MTKQNRQTKQMLSARDNLDFEIEFYKSIIKEAPDYADALMLLGEAYIRKGLYTEGLHIDRRLANLRPQDPIVHYNLACNYSLMKKEKEALQCLKKSIRLGYSDLQHLATDPDLAPLHDNTAFHNLLRRLRKKIIAKIKNGYYI